MPGGPQYYIGEPYFSISGSGNIYECRRFFYGNGKILTVKKYWRDLIWPGIYKLV
jgi:hypothetical protein